MTPEQFLDAYAAGWCNGKPQEIQGACALGFVFVDPGAGEITLAGFPAYFQGLQDLVEKKRQGVEGGSWAFMELSHVRTWTEGFLRAWCQWKIPGTPIEGAGLIKVGPNGVLEEKIFYHAKPAA